MCAVHRIFPVKKRKQWTPCRYSCSAAVPLCVDWYERIPNDVQQTQCCAMDHDVTALSITAMHTLRLSSRTVDQRGGCDRSIVFSDIQQWQIRITAAWFRPTR
ncbi:hypothetical protein TNCV_821541 [Trichonephila clavipes]|nr:hypothetical protein TNCV_821541 [Trichonephila clavipes]